MGALMHEALHGNLFRRPMFDQWIGFLLAVPTLFSASAYKVAHLNHHRYTRSEQDQDEFSYSCRTHGQYVALFYVSFLIGSILYMILVPLKAYEMASPHSRRRIITEYTLMFFAFTGAVILATIAGHAKWLLWYWMMPIGVAVLLSNVRALSEHMGTHGKGDAILKTRTVTSNPLVSFLMCNLNYHLEHHLFPGVPWYNLPKIHKLLTPIYKSKGAEVRQSYAAFALRCLRRIPEPVDSLPTKASLLRSSA
jgi:fatty acid desaturase